MTPCAKSSEQRRRSCSDVRSFNTARRGELRDYVLDDFGKHEEQVVRDLFPALTDALQLWTKDGITPVMNKYTGDSSSP